MTSRGTNILLGAVLVGSLSAAAAWAAAPKLEKATFAGGCFWSSESTFEGLKGVKSVVSGYSGGTVKNPTYDEVCTGTTGHAEAVQVTFDPAQISYAQLVDLYWHNIDPTVVNAQFCDHGPQYRSLIFVASEAQRRVAEESKKKLAATPQRFKDPIVTAIVPYKEFWAAEEYHQDFYKKNPKRYGSYRVGCGRDKRLTELWGEPGRMASH